MRFHPLPHLKFLLKSFHLHGVHSPFIHGFSTHCLHGKNNPEDLAYLREMKKQLPGDSSLKQARLFLRIIDYFEIQKLLVFTETIGLTPQIYELRPFENYSFFTQNKELKTGALGRVQFINTHRDLNQKWGLVFFDRSIPLEDLSENFRGALPFLTEKSLVIIDGIHRNKEAEQTWGRLKNHPKVRQSVDLFFWGVVFFRKHQARENFWIRV